MLLELLPSLPLKDAMILEEAGEDRDGRHDIR
jgi:hypothetical protein